MSRSTIAWATTGMCGVTLAAVLIAGGLEADREHTSGGLGALELLLLVLFLGGFVTSVVLSTKAAPVRGSTSASMVTLGFVALGLGAGAVFLPALVLVPITVLVSYRARRSTSGV